MMPLLDRTLLQVAIDTVLPLDPEVVVVNAHHLADKLERYIRGRDFGAPVVVSRERNILGSAGGIKAAQKWLGGGDFAVVNSDVIAQVDWEGMQKIHRENNSLATLMLREAPLGSDYGSLCVDGEGRITRFLDSVNSGYEQSQKPMMFTGISILSGEMLERIPAGRAVDISRELYRPMTERREALYGHISTGSWTDAGTTALYHKVVMDMLDQNPELVETGGKEYAHVKIIPPVYIDPQAHIRAGCILGPRVAIHARATLGACVYMKNCVVLPGRGVRSGGALEGEVL